MKAEIVHNPQVVPTLQNAAPTREPLRFHQQLPDYAPAPLVSLPDVAAALGVDHVSLKDESWRLGLPSFKILGASWAIYRQLTELLGGDASAWTAFDELKTQLAPLLPVTLVAATDGNHGRAVAHMARLLGCAAQIFVPSDMAEARIAALKGAEAQVVVVDGTYDDAVVRSAAAAGPKSIVISDTAWPGYADVPRWVIEGYSTMFWEIDDVLAQRAQPQPDLVLVQIGVGALAAAVIQHYRRPEAHPPTIIGVEPLAAACVLGSLRAGEPIVVPGPHTSIMAGLNCGVPSPIAWPVLIAGLDAVIAIDDERARQAMRMLAAAGRVVGETGAAALGGLIELLDNAQSSELRARYQINDAAHVLIIATEGATDPQAYAQIVGDTRADRDKKSE